MKHIEAINASRILAVVLPPSMATHSMLLLRSLLFNLVGSSVITYLRRVYSTLHRV